MEGMQMGEQQQDQAVRQVCETVRAQLRAEGCDPSELEWFVALRALRVFGVERLEPVMHSLLALHKRHKTAEQVVAGLVASRLASKLEATVLDNIDGPRLSEVAWREVARKMRGPLNAPASIDDHDLADIIQLAVSDAHVGGGYVTDWDKALGKIREEIAVHVGIAKIKPPKLEARQ